MLICVTSDGTSTVIGMRGSLTINMEAIPTIVKSNVDRMITAKVHPEIFSNIFDERSLLIEQIAVKRINGTTMYLPMRMNNSVKKTIASLTLMLSKGKRNDAKIPKEIPSKYFIQTFILSSASYVLIRLSKVTFRSGA